MEAGLNWLQKILRTDIRYVLGGGFWLLLNQGFTFALSVIFLWVFTNYLNQETYGEYRFITTVATLLALTALPGSATTLVRSVARGYRGTLVLLVKERIRWGFIGSAIALVGASYYFTQDDSRLALLFLLIAITVPFLESYSSYQYYLNGLKEFKDYALLRTLKRFIVVTASITPIFLGEGIIVIVTCFFASTILSDRLLLWYTTKKYPLDNKQDEGALSYAKHLSVMSGLKLGAQHLDKVALWYFAGPVQVAVYAVAMAIPQELVSGVGQISKLALPKMSHRSASELQQALLRKTFIYFIIVSPLVFLYVITSPYLFSAFFPEYYDSVFFTQVAALLLFITPSGLLMQYFVATENKRVQYKTTIVEPLVQILLYMILIPTFGVLGAVLAVLIKHTVVFGLLILFFVKEKY